MKHDFEDHLNNKTTQVGLIGWPIAHSLSPVMQNAAFAALGLDWQYRLFPTQPAALAALLESLTAKKIVGGNVTMPHKQAIMPYLEEMSADARLIGAVNTFRVQDGKIFGYNTDNVGFLNALKEAGHEPRGLRVLMLGAGGAARAAVFSLAQAGVDRIIVINRTIARGEQLCNDMASAFPACHFTFLPLLVDSFVQTSTNVDLIVNATSVGMEPNEHSSIWPDEVAMPVDTIFYDVIYKPTQTLFLQKAQAAGLETINGLGMLIHQGAVAFELWTGQKAPLETMRQACLKALRNGQ